MAWTGIQDKLIAYVQEPYAKTEADLILLREYGATNASNVPLHRREDFEKDLDYRLGACINLRRSKGTRWLV